MSFAARLKFYREKKGLSQQELADALGVSRSAVTKYEAGERFPDEAILLKIANVLGCSLDSLMGRNDRSAPGGIYKESDILPARDLVPVPVLGVIRAGEPVMAEENIIDTKFLPADEVRGGEYFYLKVKGDSMVGARIYDGDLVLVRQQDTCEDGEIAVVMINGEEATLKRVYRSNDSVILKPENPAYRPIVVDGKDLRVIGVVKEVRFKL
ncbi:MAG: repressor LexA [Clostridia bacterium]|nr:repressor LexA [Clostridia bacterium]